MQASTLGQAVSPGLLYHSRDDAGSSSDPFRFGSTSTSRPPRRSLQPYPSCLEPGNAVVEEELVWYGKTVIWSRGVQIFRKYTFDYEGEEVAWASFVWFNRGQSTVDQSKNGKAKAVNQNNPEEQATFGPFQTSHKYRWGGPRISSTSAKNPERLERTLVIFLQTRAHVYYSSGEDVIVNIPFVIDGTWALDDGGVVVQRALEKREIRHLKRKYEQPGESLLRGIDQTSASILEDLVDLEDENAPSLPRLYTLDNPFHELKVVVEARVEGGFEGSTAQITSHASPISSSSTLLHLSSDSHPLAVYYDHEDSSIVFCRRVRIPPTPETPPPPVPGPRTMRPEDILNPPEPVPPRPRPSLHRNPSAVAPVADRRRSTTADLFDRSNRRNQPRLSRGGDQDAGATGDLQAALEPPMSKPAIPISNVQNKRRSRGMSIVSASAENRRTSGASSFMRQDVRDPLGKNALHGAGEKDLRETTMMLGLEREETELRSDIVLDRLWTWKPPSGTDPASLKVFLSDNLSPQSVIVNIHLAISDNDAHLFTFHVQHHDRPRRHVSVTPFQSFSCVNAIPLISTRNDVLDVLVLSQEGALELVTSGGRNIPISVLRSSQSEGDVARKLASSFNMVIDEDAAMDSILESRIVDLVDPIGSNFTMVLEDGERIRISLDFTIKDRLVNWCMEAISLSVAPESFYLFKKEVLLQIQPFGGRQRSDPCGGFDVFARVLRRMLGCSASMPTTWSGSCDHVIKKLASRLGKRYPEGTADQAINVRLESQEIAPIVLALHFVAQGYRLTSQVKPLELLVPVIIQLATKLGKNDWVDYWMRLMPVEFTAENPIEADTKRLDIYETPPDILAYLARRLLTPTVPFPTFASSTSELGRPRPLLRIEEICEIYDKLGIQVHVTGTKEKLESLLVRASAAVLLMVKKGLDAEWIASLPYAVAIPILEMIRVCQNSPDRHWSPEVFAFIGRMDLATQCQDDSVSEDREMDENEQPTIDDLISLESAPKRTHRLTLPHVRFGSDRRLQEVERMMQTTKVRTIAAQEQKNASEQDIVHYHQSVVNIIANRTLSIPVGQGIFEYGTRSTNITGIWEIPLIELSVKIVPGNSVLKAQIVAENADWPCFHNGVSAGLSISPDCKGIDSSWIVFNRPHTLNPEHGGFLLGLGLTGHLRSLLTYHAFPYMEPRHEFTSVGLLLGLACSYAGSGDLLITKILSLHTHALLPLGSMELYASPLIQSTALVGLGLVYVGSKNHRMAEVALAEVGRGEMLGVDAFGDFQEAYAFSASMAFGLIMLGRGGNSEVDRRMLAKLRKSINGDVLDSTTPISSPLTSPGATLALGLMYLKTGRRDIADTLEIPKTAYELEQIRPDLLLLRTFSRALIMWDEVNPAMGWIEAQLPDFIQHRNHKKTSMMDFATELAYLNIVSGACFAIGLKHAGTAAELAHNNLMFFYGVLGKAAASQSMTYEGRIRRNTARHGLNIVTIALSVVMSGTGELNVLRRLRVAHGQEGAGVNYGSHMAMHMATGLLFLGRGHYTLGNSNLAIATMSIAFFPRFLPSASDNKAYPQAFRHLWALAVEPRCLIARDVDTKETVYLPVKIKLKEGDRIRQQSLISPTLISPFESLISIEVDSPRYWPIIYDLSDPKDRSNLVKTRTIYVKRKAGFLDYNSDPKGNRSIFVRAGSMTGFDLHYDLISPAAPPSLGAKDVIELIGAHSGDPSLLAMAQHFSGDSQFESFVRTILLECVSLDKPAMIGIYLSMFLALQVQDQTNTTLQISWTELLKVYYSPLVYDVNYLVPNSAGEKRFALLRPSFLTAVSRRLLTEEDSSEIKNKYMNNGYWPVRYPIETKRLAIYLARNYVPPLPFLQAMTGLVRGSRQVIAGISTEREKEIIILKVRDAATRYLYGMERIYYLSLGLEVDPSPSAWRGWKADSVREVVGFWSMPVVDT